MVNRKDALVSNGTRSDPASRKERFKQSEAAVRLQQLQKEREIEREECIRKGLITDGSNRQTLSHNSNIFMVGTCQEMCSEYERYRREEDRFIDRLECNPVTGEVDPKLTVKRFVRPAAGIEPQLPSDVRPPNVLKKTLEYLITKFTVDEETLQSTHSFLRDRTRAIRNDFSIQNIKSPISVECYEQISRLHILALHILQGSQNFEAEMEVKELKKTLMSLISFYDDLRGEYSSPNEAEFQAYNIAINLQHRDILFKVNSLPRHILLSPDVQHVLRLYALAQRPLRKPEKNVLQVTEACMNSYTRFFKLAGDRRTSYMLACILEEHFPDVRKGALVAMKKCFLKRYGPYPLADLTQALFFDSSQEALAFCEHFDISSEVTADKTVGIKLDKIDPWPNKQTPSRSFSTRLVEAKRGARPLKELINLPSSCGNVRPASIMDTFLQQKKVKLSPAANLHKTLSNGRRLSVEKSHLSQPSITPTFQPLSAFQFKKPTFVSDIPSPPFKPHPLEVVPSPPPSVASSTHSPASRQIPLPSPVTQSIQSAKRAAELKAVAEKQKEELVALLSNQIMESLIEECILETTATTIASTFYSNSLRRHVLRRFSAYAHRLKLAALERKRIELEREERRRKFEEAVREMSVVSLMNTRHKQDFGTLQADLSKTLLEANEQTTTLWKPLDLQKLFLGTVNSYFEVEKRTGTWKLLITYVDELHPCAVWLRAKMGFLEGSKEDCRIYKGKHGNFEVSVSECDTLTALQDVGAILVSCPVAVKDWEMEKERFHRVMRQVSKSSRIKFSVLVIHWMESVNSQIDISQLLDFSSLFGSSYSISNLHVLQIHTLQDTDLVPALERLVNDVNISPSPWYARQQTLERKRKRMMQRSVLIEKKPRKNMFSLLSPPPAPLVELAVKDVVPRGLRRLLDKVNGVKGGV